jgi:SAM-dependent methyltransferase
MKELRYERPKEVFRAFRKILKERLARPGLSLLDAGCATGELLYYLKGSMRGSSHLEGIDISPVMIARAKRNVPGVHFKLGSVLNRQLFRKRRYDVVVLSGVMQIFDDPAIVLENMRSCVNEGGTVIVSGPFNDDPIDVFMRYRRSGRPGARMELGWNFFSCQTIEKIVKKLGYKLRIRWQEFRMPYAIPKRADDPMRTWTIRTEHNRYQLVNGASQLVKMKILIMDMVKVQAAK